MKPIKDRIEEIKINGYQLDFADVFNHAFENYKKIALYAGLVIFICTVIVGVLMAGAINYFFDIANLNENLVENLIEKLKSETTSINFIMAFIVGNVLITSLVSPLKAGFLKMADCGEKDETFRLSAIFSYYKAPYFLEIFIATLTLSIISISLSMLLNLTGIEAIGMLTTYALSFLTLFTIPFIIFGKLKAFDAIKASIIIVMKQPLIILGLIIVAFFASMVGFIGCFIGVFFTIPFLFSINYSLYNTIVGIDPEQDLEKNI
jgi:MFS family permease